MEANVKSFPLKLGSCHIYQDSIQIKGKGISSLLSRFFFKRGFQRVVLFYGLMALAFLVFALLFISLQNYFLALFLAIAALFSLRLAWINKKISFAPFISKKQIEYISYHPAVPGESRTFFQIVYTSGKRTLIRRLILPTKKGEMIAQSAYYMIKDTGLLKLDEPTTP